MEPTESHRTDIVGFFQVPPGKNIIYLLSFLSVDPKIQREKT
jgi:hypothetical protein